MKQLYGWVGVIAIAWACGTVLTPHPTGAQAEDPLGALSKRVMALEKIVVADPLNPSQPLLKRVEKNEDRLDALEKRSGDLTKAADRIRPDERPTQLRDDLDRQTKALLDLDRRLKEVERPGARVGGEAGELRQLTAKLDDLSRRLSSLERDINDVSSRLSRVEAKR